jgi:hypothetical protein
LRVFLALFWSEIEGQVQFGLSTSLTLRKGRADRRQWSEPIRIDIIISGVWLFTPLQPSKFNQQANRPASRPTGQQANRHLDLFVPIVGISHQPSAISHHIAIIPKSIIESSY